MGIGAEALDLLEWPRLCSQVASFAVTTSGKRFCQALPLALTPAASQELLEETTELLALDGLSEGGLSFQGVADLTSTVALCAKGGTAGGESLLEVATTLAAARRLRRQIDDPTLRPTTTALIDSLRTLPELEQRLQFCLEEGGRVADRASPALQGLRRQLAGVRADRRERLQDLLRRWAPSLQDTVIAERNGRPVLAVKAGAAAQLPGLVHDSSASGSTVFLEPQAVVPLSNRIRELEGKERELEEAVLRELSGLVGQQSEALQHLQSVLLQLEAALARARYGAWLGALRPEISPDPLAPWALEGLRHPLLLWQERKEAGRPVVPVSVRVNEPVRVVAFILYKSGCNRVILYS
ncbi:MAG: endonuclease MutS2, partial [Cyanobacteriota bacterium]